MCYSSWPISVLFKKAATASKTVVWGHFHGVMRPFPRPELTTSGLNASRSSMLTEPSSEIWEWTGPGAIGRASDENADLSTGSFLQLHLSRSVDVCRKLPLENRNAAEWFMLVADEPRPVSHSEFGVFVPPSTIYDAVKKATVAVVASVPGGAPFPYSILGSGVCIDSEGIIVTCEHVFSGFFTPETREREKHARQAEKTFTGNCVIPHVLFYLGVQEKEHRISSCLLRVSQAVKDETHGFDLAVLRLPPPDKQVFPEGYPTLPIAEYAELHEMMEIATCGFPLGERLHDQIGTVTSSFTKGIISSIIPAQGVAREHVRGFQLDLTATNGNSGGPVFSIASGRVFGLLQSGAVHPRTGHPVQGITKAEPIYPLFDTDLLARLPSSDPPGTPK